jgi:hypothetical protein
MHGAMRCQRSRPPNEPTTAPASSQHNDFTRSQSRGARSRGTLIDAKRSICAEQNRTRRAAPQPGETRYLDANMTMMFNDDSKTPATD